MTAEDPADAIVYQAVADEGLRLRKVSHTHQAIEIVTALAKAMKK